MKNFCFVFLLSLSTLAFGQGKSISFSPRIDTPYVCSSGDTISVGQTITLLVGSGTDGNFSYVQLLNSFNEPIKQADSRAALKKQPVKFFKEQDGTMYLFTKFFAINIEAALLKSEIKIK